MAEATAPLNQKAAAQEEALFDDSNFDGLFRDIVESAIEQVVKGDVPSRPEHTLLFEVQVKNNFSVRGRV